MTKFAVDFGTTNTLVARRQEGKRHADILTFPSLSRAAVGGNPGMIPSLLYVENESVPEYSIGEQVRQKEQSQIESQRRFAAFKRLIAFSRQRFPVRIGNEAFSYQRIGDLFLERICAEFLTTDSRDEIIFTLPVESFEFYRHWLKAFAAQRFPHCQVGMIEEAVAAAIGCGVSKPDSLLLVVDFGGGTLDIALIKLPKILVFGASGGERSRVIAKAGKVLGGEDIDEWLLEDILQENRIPKSEISNFYAAFKDEAERTKIVLSENTEAEFNCITPEREYRSSWTRDRLEVLLTEHKFHVQIQNVLDNVLSEAQLKGIDKADIEHVILVGGTCLMPSVQKLFKQMFGEQRVCGAEPFTAVVQGALHLLEGFQLDDYIYHNYGLRYLNQETAKHEYKLLFPKGTACPLRQPVELNLGCSRSGQEAIELVIAEMQQNVVGINEIVFDGVKIETGDRSMEAEAIVPLNEDKGSVFLAKLDPPGRPGRERINVRFTIDERKKLFVTIRDLFTNRVIYEDMPVTDLK